MEITKEQLSKLRKKLGDKELKEIGIKLPVEYDKNKIYCFFTGEYFYKLSREVGNNYFWAEIANSFYSIHDYGTIDKCINSIAGYEIQEFDNVRDFAEWILTNTKK